MRKADRDGRIVVEVRRSITQPADEVLAQLRALSPSSDDHPNEFNWAMASEVFEDLPASAHVTDTEVVLSSRVPRIPWFGLFMNPLIVRDTRKRLDAIADGISGRAPQRAVRRPVWAAPVALTAHQARTIATVGFILAITGYTGSLLTQAIDPIAQTYGASNFQLGLVTGFTRTGALIALAGSALADRRGRRTLLLAAVVVACLASVGTALAPNLAVLAVLQVLVRAAANLAGVVGLIAAVEEAPEGARAWTLAMTGLAGTLGFVLGAALLPVTDFAPWAWRILFGLAFIGLPLLPALSRHLQETRRYTELARRTASRGRMRELVDPLYGGRFWVLAATAFLINVFFAPSSQFTNRYLSDEQAFSGAGIFVLRATMQSIPALIAVWAGGRIAESKGRRPAAIGGLVVMAFATAGFFLTSGPLLWIMLLASTAAAALSGPALAAFNTELFPTEVRGTAGAGLLLAAVLGSVAGLFFAGALSAPLKGIGPAVAITAIGPLLAAIFLVPRLPEGRGRDLDDLSPPEV